MDQVMPNLRNMQSTRIMDWIYPNYPDLEKKISDVLVTQKKTF